jgi:hypothetical protein
MRKAAELRLYPQFRAVTENCAAQVAHRSPSKCAEMVPKSGERYADGGMPDAHAHLPLRKTPTSAAPHGCTTLRPCFVRKAFRRDLGPASAGLFVACRFSRVAILFLSSRLCALAVAAGVCSVAYKAYLTTRYNTRLCVATPCAPGGSRRGSGAFVFPSSCCHGHFFAF